MRVAGSDTVSGKAGISGLRSSSSFVASSHKAKMAVAFCLPPSSLFECSSESGFAGLSTEAEDDDALDLLMRFYGYKTIDFTTKDIIKDFDATDLWWTDVSLFENREELNNTVKMFMDLMGKVDKDDELTEDDKNKLSVMADLGIYDLTDQSKFITNFEAVQIELLKSD